MSLSISRILHAGYLFEDKFTKIIFDPIFENPFSRNCFAFPEVSFDYKKIQELKVDAIFISHYHDDHLSLESLNYLKKTTPIYIYCLFEELIEMVKSLGFLNIRPIQLNHPIQIGEISVLPLPALDLETDCLFHISAYDQNILNVVDSWIDPDVFNQLLKVAQWDLVLWPFQTMRELEALSPLRAEVADRNIPIELAEQLRQLKPKNLIPSSCQFKFESWSWLNQFYFPISYESFNLQIKELIPSTNVFRLDPSATITLSKNEIEAGANLDWINCSSSSADDYAYDSHLKIPSLSEVAQNFEKLPGEASDFVMSYCLEGLPKTFESLSELEESYFSSSRVWQLNVYNHLGEVKEYFYSIETTKIKLLNQVKFSEVVWLTEISEARLYAALTQGESLSSLYIRLNDRYFDSKTEVEIESADILHDPMIRCLYEGKLGSYQKAQLTKILNRH